MEMTKIIQEMESNLETQQGAVLLFESRVKILQEAFDKAKKELDEEMAQLKAAKDKAYATEQAIEILKMGNFDNETITTEETAKAETPKEKPVTIGKAKRKDLIPEKMGKKEQEKKPKELTWRHKKAFVLKLNQYDNVLDRWPSQKSAARGMNWDQSSISKFMKLSKETQLKKKGFYLIWEY